jgi:hypothetical protein
MGYGFNLKNVSLLHDLQSNERYQFNLYRNRVFLTGNAAVVQKFYKVDAPTLIDDQWERNQIRQSYLYRSKTDEALVFYGIIKMINDAYVRLVCSNGFNVKVSKKDGQEDVEKTKILEKILDFNSFKSNKWMIGESLQSGLGHFAYKTAIDTDISKDYPIIEIVEPEYIEVIKKRDFVVGYIFKQRKTVGDRQYELRELWEKEGTVTITYQLWDVTDKPVQMEWYKETEILKSFGMEESDEVVMDFDTLDMIPVLLKTNTGYNSWFLTSSFGEADTQGLDKLEDTLTEILSSLATEIRKARVRVLVAEDLIPHNENGAQVGEYERALKDYEVIRGDLNDAKNLIQYVQGDINAEKYLEVSKQYIANAINKAKLHPITVGITGLESIVSSAESQVEREKTSIRTRELKLNGWREGFQHYFNGLLKSYDLMHSQEIGDYDITIDFGEYVNPSPENVVATIAAAIQGQVMDIRTALKEYYGDDKSDEEIEVIALNIKVENNKALTPAERTTVGLTPQPTNPIEP